MKEYIFKNWVNILLLAFLFYVFALDTNGLPARWRLNHEISKLKEQRDYYREKIIQDSLLLENLKDDAFLEKYAREKYLMKRPGETIYIVK